MKHSNFKATLLMMTLVSVGYLVSYGQEHEPRDEKKVLICWLENDQGEIVKVGSICPAGDVQCVPNPC